MERKEGNLEQEAKEIKSNFSSSMNRLINVILINIFQLYKLFSYADE